MTAPSGTIDDAGRVRLSRSVMTREGVCDRTAPMGSSKAPERKTRKMPAKKVSRVIDVQKNNQLKYSFTGEIQLSQSALEFEDLLVHHGDGLRRRDKSPVVSDGGTNESREDPQCDDPGWNEQHLEKFG